MGAYLWLAFAAAALIVEIATVNLVSIWFVAGAAAAFVSYLLGASLYVQVGVFIVVSALLLVFLMPAARKLVNKNRTATNSDRIIGQEGICTERINNIDGSGQIKVMGNIWSAQSVNGEEIEKGEYVTVTEIRGVKAVVKAK